MEPRGAVLLQEASADGSGRLEVRASLLRFKNLCGEVDLFLTAGADGSSGRSPSSRAAAPRPPSHHLDDTESAAPQEPSSPSSFLPPPAVCRRANAPSPPSLSPNHTPPLPAKPPPSPGNSRGSPSLGGKPASSTSLAPPPSLHLVSNGPTGRGEVAPELPQRHNSLSTKRAAPSPGGSTRGPAPPPPTSPIPQHGTNRPPPPLRETPCRGAGELLVFLSQLW